MKILNDQRAILAGVGKSVNIPFLVFSKRSKQSPVIYQNYQNNHQSFFKTITITRHLSHNSHFNFLDQVLLFPFSSSRYPIPSIFKTITRSFFSPSPASNRVIQPRRQLRHPCKYLIESNSLFQLLIFMFFIITTDPPDPSTPTSTSS